MDSRRAGTLPCIRECCPHPPSSGLGRALFLAVRADPENHSPLEEGRGLLSSTYRASGVGLLLGGSLPGGRSSGSAPLPGLAHAFVFWGFLAFALVSLNHIANGLGLGFLSPESAARTFLFPFCRGMGSAGRRLDRGTLHPPILRTSHLARAQGLLRVRVHCPADLSF